MNSLKSFFMLLVLVGVGYGVYRTLHLKNPQQVPTRVDTSIPAIDLQLSSALPGSNAAPGGTAPKFESTPSTPPPTNLAPREPRRDNIVNAPFAQSNSALPTPTTLPGTNTPGSPTAPPTSIGFGEPANPAPRGNDLKLDAPPASDNPGSALLPPLATSSSGPELSLPAEHADSSSEFNHAANQSLTPPVMSGNNPPANATPSNLPPGATPLTGFSSTATTLTKAHSRHMVL